MVMTQQYLAGELSVLLAQLHAAAPDRRLAGDIAGLRREAETVPVTTLASVAARAMRLADVLCWESLSRGDTVAFCQQVAVSAELYEFGVCSGLLGEGWRGLADALFDTHVWPGG